MVFAKDFLSRLSSAAINLAVVQIVGSLGGVLGQVGRHRIGRDPFLPEPDLSNDHLVAEPDLSRGLTATLDTHTLGRHARGHAQITGIDARGSRSEGVPRPVQAQDGVKVHDPAALELGDLGKREPADAGAL